MSISFLYRINNECFHSCNGKNIFIRLKMKCSNQLGFASLIGKLHLSAHENNLTIAFINIHYLYIDENLHNPLLV